MAMATSTSTSTSTSTTTTVISLLGGQELVIERKYDTISVSVFSLGPIEGFADANEYAEVGKLACLAVAEMLTRVPLDVVEIPHPEVLKWYPEWKILFQEFSVQGNGALTKGLPIQKAKVPSGTFLLKV